MAKVFVSYRRSDSADTVGRICDRLADVLGEDNIFKDVDSIAPGVERDTVIDRMLDRCDAFLVVIGRNWLMVRNAEGALRLGDPSDPVRMEIEKALAKRMRIIPVLVGNAIMPVEKQLPHAIRDLVKMNPVPIRPDPDFNRDLTHLIQNLKGNAPRVGESSSDGYIRLPCLQCGKSLKLLPTHAGKLIRCKNCAALLNVDAACASLSELQLGPSKDSQPAPSGGLRRIFISYRRSDDPYASYHLRERLAKHFGSTNVFMDDGIPYGVDFVEYLQGEVQKCNCFLAIIGDDWLVASFEDGPRKGQRRLDDANDFVRIEVESALSRRIPVIPILVGRANMPRQEDLPNSLKKLSRMNAAEVRVGRDMESQITRLIEAIEKV